MSNGMEAGRADARDLLARGRALLEAGESARALEVLRDAVDVAPADARVRSYYGLAVGLVDRRFEQASALCHEAAKQEFYNPDLYLNLARLHLAFGFRSEGLRYLRRGQLIDPGHGLIADELLRLGRRSPPVLTFLPRRHPLNRWLGTARAVVRRRSLRADSDWPRGRRPRGAVLAG